MTKCLGNGKRGKTCGMWNLLLDEVGQSRLGWIELSCIANWQMISFGGPS